MLALYVVPVKITSSVAVIEVSPETPAASPPILPRDISFPVKLIAVRALLPPRVCERDTFPLPAVRVRLWAPLIVLVKIISPPLLVKTAGARAVIGPEWEMLSLVVVIVPPMLTGPLPF